MLLWLMVAICAAADDTLVRIEERLTTDRDFYDLWMDLIRIQNRQYAEQDIDFPLSFANEEIFKCGRAQAEGQDTTNGLRPKDIGIIAEMGHLSTYCTSDFNQLKEGLLEPCTRKSSSMSHPSLYSLFKARNPNVTAVTVNERDDMLTQQAKALAAEIQQIPGYESIWKMIVIVPSIQDGEASETGQTAVEVLTAIEELNRLLPYRTFIVVVRSSGSGIWHDASHGHKACREMLSRWKNHNKFNSKSVWDQVDAIVQKNFMHANFTVEILPLLQDSALPNLPDMVDMSSMGYDCAHFSERGLSMLHLSIWNSLMTTTAERKQKFTTSPESLRCPDPRCPFIRTSVNSGYCIWSSAADNEDTIIPQLIVISILVLAITLAVIVLLCLCRRSQRTEDIRNPVKAFGASFSSIKFIDEDII